MSEERIEFLAPLPPVRLRTNTRYGSWQGRKRLHDEYQEQVWCAGHEYAFRFGDMQRDWKAAGAMFGGIDRSRIGGLMALPWSRAHLTLTWRHHRVGPDEDNALASLKPLIDVLTTKSNRPLGIVVDDDPAHLSVTIRTEKVSRKIDEGILVSIRRDDERND